MDHRFGATAHRAIVLMALCLILPPALASAEEADRAPQGTRIIGSQDVPPGLYIMPWRRAGEAPAGTPRIYTAEEPPGPVDPKVLERELYYRQRLGAGD